MADQDLQFIISAVDKASAEFKRISAELEKLGKTSDEANKHLADGAKESTLQISSLDSAINIASRGFSLLSTVVQLPIKAFTSLFDISSDLVREFDAQAQAEVKLTSALKFQGDVTRETVQNLKAYANALQQTTRFGDEAILGVEAIIAGFVSGEEPIKRATAATLDYAAAFGVDVNTAAMKVAQAIETGSINVGKMSIELTKATEPAARLNEVLSGLETRFGGVAAAVAVIGAGPLDQLANAYSGLKSTLGELIGKSPQFLAFIDSTKELLKGFQDFATSNSTEVIGGFGKVFQTSMQLMVLSIQSMIFSVEKLVTVTVKVGEWLGIFDSVEDVQRKMIFLANDTYYLNNELERLKEPFQGLSPIFSLFAKSEEEAAKRVVEVTEKLAENEVKWDEFRKTIEDMSTSPMTELKKVLGEVTAEAARAAKEFEKLYQAKLKEREAETPEAVQARKAASIERATSNVEAAGLTGDLDPFVQELKKAAEEQQKAAELLQAAAQAAAAQDAASSAQFLTDIDHFDGSVTEWKTLLETQGKVLASWTIVVEAQNASATSLLNAGSGLGSSATSLSGSGAALSGSATGLGTSADELKGAGADLSGSAGSMDRAADALKEAADALGGLGGGKPFAVGGIVQRATRAIIGESGPEVVIPLNADGAAFAARALGLGEGSGGGMSINISARNLTLSDKGLDAVFSQFDRKLADSLSRQRRLKSGSL